MKNTKKTLNPFFIYDRTGMQNYLEEQAQKGWMLDKITALGWQFHRMEPKKIHYSVVYFAGASDFDPEPSEELLLFREFCEHTGWKLAAANAQMQVFCNEEEEPIPIETDARLEVSAIHAVAKKRIVLHNMSLLLMGVLMLLVLAMQFATNPIWFLTSKLQLCVTMMWILLPVIELTILLGYYSWYRRAKAAAELDGSFVETTWNPGLIGLLVFCTVVCIGCPFIFVTGPLRLFLLLVVAVVLAIVALVMGASVLMKKKKLSARRNRNVTVLLTVVLSLGLVLLINVGVIFGYSSFQEEKHTTGTYEHNGWNVKIYKDEIPLTIEDLTHTEYEGYSYQLLTQQESALAGMVHAMQHPLFAQGELPELNYIIVTVKAPFLYDLCRNRMLNEFLLDGYGGRNIVEVNAAPWGANEAYQLQLDGETQQYFLLMYEDRIVKIEFDSDEELTPEQRKTVGEKLGK